VIILDTDIISILDARSGAAFFRLAGRLNEAQAERVAVTIISIEEQMRGWLSYLAAAKTMARQLEGYARLHRMIRWYEQQEVLDFDARAAREYEQLKRARVRVGQMDLKIAAIALAQDALLVSRNLRDFQRVPGLQVADWTLP
jgi:tRNA(fMet)-specific endonuclease VapC